MYSDVIFIRTAKGEREKANLPDNLKRALLLINGQSASSELVKHAPPSLRKEWDETLGELLKGGYIAKACAAVPEPEAAARKSAPWSARFSAGLSHTLKAQPQPETASGLLTEKAAKLKGFFAAAREKATAEEKQAALEMAQARAALEATAARRRANAGVKAEQREEEDARARVALEVAIAAAKARSDAEAKAQSEARQRDVNTARMLAEHEAAMARAAAEARLRAEKTACAHAEREVVVASVQARAVELAKAQADARQREEEAARTRAELEAAIKAAKRRTEAGPLSRGNTSQNAEAEIPANFATRLRDLEIENDTLKRLLSEAYQEIGLLKKRIRG